MISAILFINSKAKVVISRFYRENISRNAVSQFRKKLLEKAELPPVICIDKCSFCFVRIGDLFVTAVTKLNANPALIFQFLYNLTNLLKSYFGGKFDETALSENFALTYELLDETMDHGYPQITSVDILSSFIQMGNAPVNAAQQNAEAGLTNAITGQVDWRQPGKYKYRKNAVFVDVLESVNLLMSDKGAVLRSDVAGKIKMKAFLTGMPECKFGMNDKLTMEKEPATGAKARRKHGTGIVIDDVTFHRCVNLSHFDRDRTITFIPPDGEFELMKYRITQNVNIPFKLIPVITEHGQSRVEYEIKIKGAFTNTLFASNVIIKIPTPTNVAKCDLHGPGKTKYEPGQNCIFWKFREFHGDAQYTLQGQVKLVHAAVQKQWSRPPITMEFMVNMFTASGLHVRFLKVFERGDYETHKWVRYQTTAGNYQVRV